MQKLSYTIMGGVLVSVLLLGCQKEDTETKRQLAEVQAELAEQKRLTAQMQAEALKNQEDKEQNPHELEQEELQKEIEQKGQNKETNNQAQKAPTPTQRDTSTQEEKAQSAPSKPKPQPEKIVRYPATVVTSSGYGQLSLRGEPSTKGIEVGSLYDGDEVLVTAKTSKCEVIGRVEGCWVRVDVNGIKGYMFDGYLNREVLSQAEKENLYGGQEQDEYTY